MRDSRIIGTSEVSLDATAEDEARRIKPGGAGDKHELEGTYLVSGGLTSLLKMSARVFEQPPGPEQGEAET